MTLEADQKLKEKLSSIYGVNVLDETIGYAKELLKSHYRLKAKENLEEKTRQVVSEACELTLSRVVNNEDVKELDRVYHSLHRCLVERNYLVKENINDPCNNYWLHRLHLELEKAEMDLFSNYIITSSLASNPGSRKLIQDLEATSRTLSRNTADVSEVAKSFSDLLQAFLQLIHERHFHIMSVGGPCIREVVSHSTGIPIPWLHSDILSWNNSMLGQKLREKVLGHDNVIDSLISTLFSPDNFRKKVVPNAFLFLGPTGVGKTHLAKTLTVHLYGNSDRLILIDDMAAFTKSDLSKLANTVAARPYSLILFEDIEKAKTAVLDNILQILVRGDFCKAVIIMTSTKERKFIRRELLDLVDDVYDFKEQYVQKNVIRMLLRDTASSLSSFHKRDFVVYPSDNAVNLLVSKGIQDRLKIERWLDKNVVPMVLENVANCKYDMFCHVYIDAHVGSHKFVLKLNKSSGGVVQFWFAKKTKMPLRGVKAAYMNDREVVNATLNLKAICSKPVDNVNDAIMDLLLSYQMLMRSINQEVIINNRNREKVKEVAQFVKDTLLSQIRGQNEAIEIIADSVLRSIKSQANFTSRPSGVYLLLGLDNASKSQLKSDVSELLKATQGKPQFIQVDLSINGFYRSRVENELSVIEAVKRWPYCVIMFNNIDNAEKSAYENLLGVLYTGVLSSGEGPLVDFRKTTILMKSDSGNKTLISRFFGCSLHDEENTQEGEYGFKFELLYNIDDVLLSNPKSEGSRYFRRLTKVECPPVTEIGWRALTRALCSPSGTDCHNQVYKKLKKFTGNISFQDSTSKGIAGKHVSNR